MFESGNRGALYRNTAPEWLRELLEKGELRAGSKRFISFSKEEDSGGQDDFGEVCIEFDAAEMYRQGAEDVEYTPEFMEARPDICMYVTGYKGREDYESSNDQDESISWESYIEDYGEEAEVVMKHIKYKKGLILSVTAEPSAEDRLPDLASYGIKEK
jgi:hypothetical protein